MPAYDVDVSTLVVAIDGPSGSGKSTLARGLARALRLRYLDTGAMYRALTWWVLRGEVDLADEAAVVARLADFDLDVSGDLERQAVAVGGHDVTAAIRSAEVTRAVSAVSAIPEVRRQLVARQRAIIGGGGIAVEGRDIGTVVCPDAPVKIFLTAAVDARAVRRSLEVAPNANDASVDLVRADLDRRDRLDSGRRASPLNQAPDAVAIDSTGMDADQVLAAALDLVRESTGVRPAGATMAGSPVGGSPSTPGPDAAAPAQIGGT